MNNNLHLVEMTISFSFGVSIIVRHHRQNLANILLRLKQLLGLRINMVCSPVVVVLLINA